MNQEVDNPEFEQLLEYLRRSRGFDFTGYKRTSLMRRVTKQLNMLGVASYSSYTDYLEVHPEEFGRLFDTILINVTSFFRDPSAWEAIAEQVIPRILAGKRPGEPIRVWSAGCASGEEAYTLAIILAEAARLRRVPRAGEDLRHRRGRGGPLPRPPGVLHRQGGRRRAPRAAGEVLRGEQRPLHLLQGPPPRGDLRPARPHPGRPHLADRPALVPQHADVPQQRDPGRASSTGSTSPCTSAGSSSWARPRPC